MAAAASRALAKRYLFDSTRKARLEDRSRDGKGSVRSGGPQAIQRVFAGPATPGRMSVQHDQEGAANRDLLLLSALGQISKRGRLRAFSLDPVHRSIETLIIEPCGPAPPMTPEGGHGEPAWLAGSGLFLAGGVGRSRYPSARPWFHQWHWLARGRISILLVTTSYGGADPRREYSASMSTRRGSFSLSGEATLARIRTIQAAANASSGVRLRRRPRLT